jgi:hypothetical protein
MGKRYTARASATVLHLTILKVQFIACGERTRPRTEIRCSFKDDMHRQIVVQKFAQEAWIGAAPSGSRDNHRLRGRAAFIPVSQPQVESTNAWFS